jgi:hypothetical protein
MKMATINNPRGKSQRVKLRLFLKEPLILAGSQAYRIGRCEDTKGHALVVDKHGIACIYCPARWKDYGI